MVTRRINAVRISGLAAVIALAAVSGGCATIFSSPTQPFAIRTEPAGAQVLMNGAYMGVTPLQLQIAREKNLNIVLRSPGYPEKALLLRRDFNPVAALNLISIVCWAIDLATGAMFRIEPDNLLVSMDPAAAPAPGQVFTGQAPYHPAAPAALPAPYPGPPPPGAAPPPPAAAPAPAPPGATPAPAPEVAPAPPPAPAAPPGAAPPSAAPPSPPGAPPAPAPPR